MIYNAYADQCEQVSGIRLVSCGHIFAKHGREINRPCGRTDWLLFYVAKEHETFYLEHKVLASAGSFILFAPGEKQHHIYEGNKTAEFYFLHFQCEALPPELSFSTSKVYDAPFNRQVCDLFDDIIEETLCKQPFYERLCIYKMLQLLTMLERSVLRERHPNNENFERIAYAVQHMNRHYDSNFSLEDYANLCSMSKYHFLRTFESIVGTTPMAYRNHLRLQHAADLLLEEKLTVEQISALVGYSSLAYFCSAFKQTYNLSPKQYQNQKR